MSLDRRELLDDEQEALRMAMDGRLSRLWTCLPGQVISVNLQDNTLEIQPTIQGQIQLPDGSYQYVNLPPLPDVPICFPNAGGFVLTLPIAIGDEVLVVFSARCIDAWWQSSGVGKPMESRMHDLSDAFAIPGPRSKPKAITGISSTNAQLRNESGDTFLEIAPGGNIKLTATTKVDVVAPIINLEGNVVVPVGKTLTVAGIPFLTHRHSTSSNPSGVPVP